MKRTLFLNNACRWQIKRTPIGVQVRDIVSLSCTGPNKWTYSAETR